MTEYPKPIITADIIIYKSKLNRGEYDVALIKRGKDPYKDSWALPGGHFDVNSDPSIRYTAQRELLEETNITNNELCFFNYYDAPGRDPRGRYVDFVFSVQTQSSDELKAGDDACDIKFFDLVDLLGNVNPDIQLAFDHLKILNDFFHKSLRTCDEGIAYCFAQEKHKGQTRRNGEPYINHPFRVARNAVKNPKNNKLDYVSLVILGYIHDLGEDCGVSVDTINKMFGRRISDAFDKLTHKDNVPYLDYILDIKKDPFATAIKVEDLLDNFPGAGKKKETYQNAYKILTG